ncbi:prephenate dehydrogenase [Candidatus Omnitrophota bacterium]
MKRQFNKIAIVGVGLIGGSIGLAVKKRGLAKEIIGIGRRKSSMQKAIKRGAIDKGTLDLDNGVEDADLIIIATPVNQVVSKVKEAARHAKEGAIIIDVNSTKEDIIRNINNALPKKVSFVGCHPMAGSEQLGVMNAEDDLFLNSVCIVTPTRNTKKTPLSTVKKFWKQLGASIFMLSPSAHDKAVANISHLPHIVSYALCNLVTLRDSKVAGNGFKDTTRIAKSSPQMWLDIFAQNKKNVLSSITSFEKELRLLKIDLRKGRKRALLNRLNAAKKKREEIG